MKFKNYWKSLDRQGKEALAGALKTSPAYLSQIANGHRNAGVKIIFSIEHATNGAIKPADIREVA